MEVGARRRLEPSPHRQGVQQAPHVYFVRTENEEVETVAVKDNAITMKATQGFYTEARIVAEDVIVELPNGGFGIIRKGTEIPFIVSGPVQVSTEKS